MTPMASVTLLDSAQVEHVVTTTREFIYRVYGLGWRPQTGTIEENFNILLAGSGPVTPNPSGDFVTEAELVAALEDVALQGHQHIHTHPSTDIDESTATGRSVIAAASALAARTAIGAGTSNLALGTSSSTAKAGDYQPTATNISDSTAIGRTILTAADAAAVRTATGAGTSSLALGSTGTTAAAGNHTHTAAAVSAVEAVTAGLKMREMTQAAYDALGSKDNLTLYVIRG